VRRTLASIKGDILQKVRPVDGVPSPSKIYANHAGIQDIKNITISGLERPLLVNLRIDGGQETTKICNVLVVYACVVLPAVHVGDQDEMAGGALLVFEIILDDIHGILVNRLTRQIERSIGRSGI
jgi:hypothetical protein